MRSFSLFIITIFIFSCTTEERTTPLVTALDMYSVKVEKGERLKDKLNFAEKFTYNKDGSINEHYVLDDNGVNKNTEKYVYDNDNEAISTYYDAVGKELSYYEHSFDKLGNKIATKSYDSETKDLLRIEDFIYDDKNNLKSKIIKEANGTIARMYQFEYDGFGNETKVQILNPDGSQLMMEEYRITEYNDKKHWLEKWGFRNDEPISYRKRTLSY